MHTIMILGAGTIGRLIACLLAESNHYKVYLSDLDMSSFDKSKLGNQDKNISLVSVDATDKKALSKAVKETESQALISALPYFCNVEVAEVARETGVHYFDLTEDTQVTEAVAALAKGQRKAFAPQCGLAPGFISIAANDLIRRFDEVESVSMRVGALPEHPNNALKYSLTWSTDGLINEYGNTCYGIVEGEERALMPLEGLESVEIDGLPYEAFNTSGGLGSLAQTYKGKVRQMDYKTLRYPGHCKDMRLLMNDLKLNEDRQTLKRILEKAVPKTYQDVVIVYVNVKGLQEGELLQETFVKKVYPKVIASHRWSAIQITTAASICAALDIVLESEAEYQGLIKQESIPLDRFLANRFGQHYNS